MDRLVPEWRVLWQKVPDATPFQSPEWLLSWWGCFGNEALFVLTAREDGQLIAVLPLYQFDEAGCRKLLPIGVSLSDYLDALVDANDSGAAGPLVASIVALPGWEECYIPDLPPRAALLGAHGQIRVGKLLLVAEALYGFKQGRGRHENRSASVSRLPFHPVPLGSADHVVAVTFVGVGLRLWRE